MERADSRQQEEMERERWTLTIEALDRCVAAGAKPDDVELLARECGIQNYKPHDRRTARVG